jgi:beta-alanine degradation protein BauB
MAHAQAYGDIATEVIFENDRVRIWKLSLAPGEETAVHRHDLDNVLVMISGDRIAAVPQPETAGPYRDYLEADVVPGLAIYVEKGGVEIARNVGQERYEEIIVELKD